MQKMSSSVLMPREAAKFIAERSVDVKINQEGIDRTAEMVTYFRLLYE